MIGNKDYLDEDCIEDWTGWTEEDEKQLVKQMGDEADWMSENVPACFNMSKKLTKRQFKLYKRDVNRDAKKVVGLTPRTLKRLIGRLIRRKKSTACGYVSDYICKIRDKKPRARGGVWDNFKYKKSPKVKDIKRWLYLHGKPSDFKWRY